MISVSSIKETSSFLVEIMPLMFIPAAAGLINSWHAIRTAWVPYAAITVVSTVAVMAVSGRAVQFVMKLSKKRKEKG